MKQFIIRKRVECGCWIAYKTIETEGYIFFVEIAHCETFGDMLVLLNVGAKING